MAKTNNEQVKLQRGRANFNFIGRAKITDFTYKLDEISEKSGYQYSRLNLGVDTGNGNVVYAELMGGFFPNGRDNKGNNRDNLIYVNSKEDFKQTFTIDFEDRFNEEILKTVNENNFIKVGLEKYEEDGKEKTLIKKFLSAYDAIDYISEHLGDGMVVNVKGNIRYSMYNDETQMRREITSIFLSKATEEKFKAGFTQTILIDKDSVSKLDKETNEYLIHAKVVDYLKEYNGKEVKRNIPFAMNYSFKLDVENPDRTKKVLTKFFKVKKGVTELIMEGEFVEGVQMGEVTEDDIPDDLKELIELGFYTKEEILGKMVIKGDRVSKAYLTKPYIQKTDEGVKFFINEEKYQEEELLLDFMYEDEDEKDTSVDDAEEDVNEDDDDSWLDEL